MFKDQVRNLLKKHSDEDIRDKNPDILEELYDTVTLLKYCTFMETQSMKPEYKKNLATFLRIYDNEVNSTTL